MENGTYEQIVSHLERELELNGLEAPDEIQLNTVIQENTQQNSGKPKPTCHHCKSQVTFEINAVNSNERKTKREIIQIVPPTTMDVPKQTLFPTITKLKTMPKTTIQIIKETENLDLSFRPVRHVAEQTTPQRDATLEQTQQTDHLPGIDGRRDKTKPNREILKITRMGTSKLHPNL